MGTAADRAAPSGPLGRYLAVDEQGNVLRATWRPAHGFVNLSIWRDDVCIETFHLSPRDATELVGFVVGAFADSVPAPSRPLLRAVTSSPQALPSTSLRHRADRTARQARLRLSGGLDRLARRLRP